MKRTMFLLMMLVLPACNSSEGQNAAVKTAVGTNALLCSAYTYTADGSGTMLIGDSNTFTLPANILSGNYVNCGTIGFDSNLAYNKLIQKFPEYQPGTVVIWIGTNDAKDGKDDAYYSKNMTLLFDYLKDKNVNVYVRSILPTDSLAYSDFNQRTIELNSILQNLITSYTYTYLDSRRFFEDASGGLDPQYTYDGLHLNAAGQDVLKQHFYEI